MPLVVRGKVKDMVLGFQQLYERVADAERRENQQPKCSGRDRVILQRLSSCGRVATLIAAHEGRINPAIVASPISKPKHDQEFGNAPEGERKDSVVVLDAPSEETAIEENFLEIEAECAAVCQRIREAREELEKTEVTELLGLEAECDAAAKILLPVIPLTEMHNLPRLYRVEAELTAESRRIWEEKTQREILELAQFLSLEAECAASPDTAPPELKIDVDFTYRAAVEIIGAMPFNRRKMFRSPSFECRLPTISEDENEIAEQIPTAISLERIDYGKKANVNVKRLIAHFESISVQKKVALRSKKLLSAR